MTSAVLMCASLMTLAACGGEEPATSAGPSASAAPSASSAASPSAAAGATGDKELCESANKAGEKMKDAVVAAMAGGNPSPAALKKILTDLNDEATALAAAGGDSAAAAALKQLGAEAAKAAAAGDPMTAADNPAFEKAGADLTAACKSAGVTVNF